MASIPRFATEKEARLAAKAASLQKKGTPFHVVQSPDSQHPDKPYVVDDAAFIRSWERLIATYENGKLTKD